MNVTALRWILPQTALDCSYEELAADGERHREGIALWAGVVSIDASYVRVSHVILLRGPGVRRGAGYIGIAPDLLNEVTDALASAGDGVYLLGQIHSHPPLFTTDLSEVDIAYGIRTPQYLSVVAPGYGMRRPAQLAECGVHVFEPGRGWRRLAREEVAARIEVPGSAAASVTSITVGDDYNA